MSDKGLNIPITTTYLPGSGSVVSVVGGGAQSIAPTPTAFSDVDTSASHQLWGPNDDWAVIAREKIEASTTAYPLIAQKVSLMFGKGATYYKEIRTADGITHDFSPQPAIDEFFLNNDIDYFLLERLMDYKTGGNLWCEFILNNVYTNVASINHLEGEFCRFGPVNSDNGKIENILFKSRWDKSGDDPATIPFLHKKNFSRDEALLIGEIGKGRFSMHSALPSPGNTLYAVPPHAALFKEDGWLDFANNIPKLMHAINKNGMLLKYHIQIPSNYWSDKFPEWDNMDMTERSKIQSTEFDLMDSFLKGTKNAGSSFISHFKVDPSSGKSYDGWKIEELSDPIKKDQFLTSVQEADNQTARSIGMDSSMSNIQPQGGKMGAGSGSDKRVGMTNMVTMSYMDQYVILEPLRRVQAINGWDPAIKFIFINDVPTTLNEDKSGVKSTLE